MITVNEKTTAWLTVTCKDKTGALAAPATLQYQIDCLTSGVNILTLTSVPTPAAAQEIEIPSNLNAIQVPANQQEYRRVTVTAGYGGTDQITTYFDYAVVNLQFIQ